MKTEEFIKQIEVFAVATNLLSADKQRVICTSCVFELHLWCEMEQLISKTVSWFYCLIYEKLTVYSGKKSLCFFMATF